MSDEDLAGFGAALQARWDVIAPGELLNWVFQQRDEVRASNRRDGCSARAACVV